MENYISNLYEYDYFILDDHFQKTVFEHKHVKSGSDESHNSSNKESRSRKSRFALLPYGSEMICKINDEHTDFLKMLPILLDRYDTLESSMESFYNDALNNTHQSTHAYEKICIVDDLLKKMHPYFYDANRRVNYIIDNLIRYCRHMADNRSIDFWYQNNQYYRNIINSEDDLCEQKDYKSKDQGNRLFPYCEKIKELFLKRDASFCQRLFSPVYRLLKYEDFSEEQASDKCNYIYQNYIAPGIHEDFDFYIGKKVYKQIKQYSISYRIMPLLHELSNAISDYFSNVSEFIHAYPNINTAQIYALFITHHYFLVEPFENTNVCLSPYYIYEQCRERLIEKRRTEGQVRIVTGNNDYFEKATDNLYQCFKDYLNKEESDKLSLIKELNIIYPKELQNYMNSILMDFHDFEQIISLEFLNILEKNYMIRKCPQCGTYFITSSRKIKYCEEHRSKHTIHQRHHKEKQKLDFPYSDIYNRYYYRLKQNIHRENDPTEQEVKSQNFKAWNDEVQGINNNYQGISDENTYINILNDICNKYNFRPPRSYKKSY